MDTNTGTSTNINKSEDTKQASSEERPYAIVLYGATSFVGQITAHYLSQFLSESTAKEGSSEESAVTWAIAGRDEDKLKSYSLS